MKRILYYEIVDMGIRQSMSLPVYEHAIVGGLFNGFARGIGTDAESALDDLLNALQEVDYDISGLESSIKSEWEPSSVEGDGESLYYHFGIVLRFTQ